MSNQIEINFPNNENLNLNPDLQYPNINQTGMILSHNLQNSIIMQNPNIISKE